MNPSIRNVLALTALAWSVCAIAQETGCAAEIRKVDQALVEVAKSDPPRATEARKLSAEAKQLLAANKAAECLVTIDRAKSLLKLS
jgi:hypothetical protein